MVTIDETAPVIVRLSTVIDAPLATVWALHTDVAAWNTDIDRTEVDTEESWSGAPVDAETDELGKALHDSLEGWLAHLKSRAEQSA
ncbi:hypothetical protein OG304_31910 [Streptomyces sp. NBC_00160]|uniref:hypothetical protein n=1 Tax=Streptomyces TaxID=1883 RepID=UPI00224DB1B4|nr:hypothetical protein [Streptomyces sp. NBC_00160]MCX5308018.1 hypothetical protein [Streptomyces sp. NBC_00160]